MKALLFVLLLLIHMPVLSDEKKIGKHNQAKDNIRNNKIHVKGYDFNLASLHKIPFGKFKELLVYFTPTTHIEGTENVPRVFLVGLNSTIIDSIDLPNIESSWNFITVEEVEFINDKNNGLVRIVARILMEPSRTSDRWVHPFVIDITSKGKLSIDKKINKILNKSFSSFKDIKDIKRKLNL